MTAPPKFTFSPKTKYEFTINFNDQHQYPGSDLRIIKCKALLKELLDLNTWKYSLRTELSDVQFGDNQTNPFSRVHFHGVIYFHTPAEVYKYLSTLHYKFTRIGRVQWNNFRPEWEEYVNKQQWMFPIQERKLRNISLKDIIKL